MRALLVISAHELDEQSLLLVLLIIITVRRVRFLGMDRDKSLIFIQFQTFNLLGVKSYGLDTNKYTIYYVPFKTISDVRLLSRLSHPK